MTALTTTLTSLVLDAAPPAARDAPLGDSVVVFAVSLLVGGLAIHVAASHLVGVGDYSDALLTALLGIGSFEALGVPGA